MRWKDSINVSRSNSIIGVIVILLLLVGIVLGYQKEKKGEKENDFQKTKELTSDYKQIFNTNIIDNPEKKYESMVLIGDQIYLFDKDNGRVDKINWKLGSSEKIIVDEKLKGMAEITRSSDQLLGFDGETIFEIEKNGLTEIGKVNITDLIKLRIWGGGWYFLANNGAVWKGGLKESIKIWTAENENLVAGANDICIDGKVWITNAGGDVMVFQKGKAEKWKVATKLPGGDIFRILGNQNSKQIVLISKKMIRGYNKESGVLVSNFNLEKIGIKDAVITEDGKEILILSQDQVIYAVKLNDEILQ